MRIGMWLLLALNGLVAAVWLAGFSVPPKPVVEPPAPTPSAKSLQLLSELPALPPRLDTLPVDSGLLRGTPGENVASPAGAPVERPGVETPVAGPEIAVNGPAPAVRSPALLAAPAESTAPSTAAPSAAPAQAAPAEPPVPAVPRPVVNTSAASVTVDLPSGGGPTCYRTALLAGDAYEAAGTALREADLGEPILQPQDRARPRYWVYWKGAPDELAGIEQRLKAIGVRDWYRLRAADGMPRLSLGVYGRMDGARRRQRELAAEAIQAQISARYPPQAKLRWTVVALPAAVEVAKDRLQGQGVRLEVCP